MIQFEYSGGLKDQDFDDFGDTDELIIFFVIID